MTEDEKQQKVDEHNARARARPYDSFMPFSIRQMRLNHLSEAEAEQLRGYLNRKLGRSTIDDWQWHTEDAR